MKLKRLHIQGFKSFKDKTVISFDEGITGIVGPNGCGKSNIVDALFWVMGEQSAKHLRGSNMQDLIFAGSSKYQPASWAEVTLVLENTNGKHVNILNTVSRPAEIQLTRKLYRNGDTEYRINGEPARLRDIHEVFMDTGAGAKSYSIIAQGEINKLVQAKPEERRSMIEEVAGITKFKIRKKESLKKLEQTELNLGRLSDLKNEVYKTLKSLEKQAEKADRAKVLREKVRKHELIVNSHKEFDLLQDYKENRDLLTSKKLSVSEWMNRRTMLENDLEEERFKKTEMMERVENMQASYNHESKDLVAKEERLKFLKRTVDDKQSQIEMREKENNEVISDIENRKLRIQELESELARIESSRNDELDFSALEEKLEVLKEELSLKEESVQELAKELNAEKNALTALEQEAFKNSSKLEEYIKNLEDINLEIETIEKQYSVVTQEMVKDREEVKTLAFEIDEHQTTALKLKEEATSLSSEFQRLDREVRAQNKEVINTESRLTSLKDLALSLDGMGKGAQEFLNEPMHAENFSLFGNLLESDPIYAKAIQNIFSDYFQSIVAKNGDVESLLVWSKENNNSSFQFIKATGFTQYEDETIERLKLNGCEEVIKLSSVIKVNRTEYAQELNQLFSGFYLVSNYDAALASRIPTGIDFKGISAFDGTTVTLRRANSVVTSSFKGLENTQGLVERNNLIQELEVKLSAGQETLALLEEQFTQTKDLLEEKTAQLESVRNFLLEKQTTHSTKKASIDMKLSNYESSNSRLSILKNRNIEISRSRMEMMENEERLINKTQTLKSNVSDLESRLENFSEEMNLARETYNDEKEELTTKMLEAKSYEERRRNMESQISDVEAQITKALNKVQSNTELLSEYNTQVETAELEGQNLAEDISNKASVLADEEVVLNSIKDELSELLFSMKEREDEARELSTKINKTEKDLVDTEVKIQSQIMEEDQIVKNIFEKHQVDLRHVLKCYMNLQEDDLEGLSDMTQLFFMETEDGTKEIDRVSYSFDRRYGQALRDSHEKLKTYRQEFSRLGEINWQAIEDYDRQKMRHDFLESQEVELRTSLNDLQMAISQIDEKCRLRFKEAYDAVNERFEKVFPIIFGGGSAKLDIVGDLDSPECGIDIIAQPPGKKMQNINLMSGGEKAMTAVSLIFSIFLVKPSPFCLLDEVDAPLDDANVGRFNELLREMSSESQFILITHNKKTMELNDTLYGVTMQEPGISKAVSVQLH
ncbi:MAG: chromosome segregation protein SMC [Bacteriovoracaceae bacterium]